MNCNQEDEERKSEANEILQNFFIKLQSNYEENLILTEKWFNCSKLGFLRN